VFAGGQRGPESGVLYFWRNKFTELTGATYDIVEIPYPELREKIYGDFTTGTHKYDVIINCSNWYGDAIANDWILPIDKYFNDPRMPKWDRESIAPVIAKLYQWGGHWYGGNSDHDAHILYYRKDLIESPKWQAEFKRQMGHDMPAAMDTWEDVLEIAKFFNGVEWNGPGKPHHGISLHLKVGGQGFFHFTSLSAPYTVLPNPGPDPKKIDKYHNIYFFDPDTMEPLINSPGHVRALEMLLALSKAGSPAMWGWSLSEAWADFLSGNSVMVHSWDDVGALEKDPAQSKIQGKLGARALPGTKHPYDMQKRQFLNLDKPNFVANQVGCSWHPTISKFAKNPDLAYYFLAWQASPPINHWNVTVGWSGIGPGTKYDWFPPDGIATDESYTDVGWIAGDARAFAGAFQQNYFKYPITQTYLRIPGIPEMFEALDIHVAEAVTGQLSPKDALDRTAADWKRILNDLGKDKELNYYQVSIGYRPR
jgi:multiple sugar transport system substrate-binding protein